MSQARSLSSSDVHQIREDLAGGGVPTVWFTASAVGVPEGRSGKVVALGDAEEGDFIQVRPAGSKDVLSFSAAEVTVVKPPRKRKAPDEAAPANSSAKAASKSTVESKPDPKPTPKAAAQAPASTSAKSASAPAKTAPNANRRKFVAGATITLTAGADGQWSVEVNNGKKRVLRPTPVAASAVAQATKALSDDVVEVVEPLLEAAREQQRMRVEQLQRELADAQRMLDELTS